MTEKAQQQVLDLHGPITPDFENYIAGPNRMLVGMLRQLASQPQGWHYLSGASATGKTHLLLAVMHSAVNSGVEARYISLSSATVAAALIDQLAPPQLLLIDDINAIGQSQVLQESVFHCLNRIHQQHQSLIVTGNLPVNELELQLPDLRSRLAKCQQYKLKGLDDADIPVLIRQYLQRYALPVDKKVVEYVSKYGPRNTGRLIKLLQAVARAALEEKRYVSIPMVSRLLERSAVS